MKTENDEHRITRRAFIGGMAANVMGLAAIGALAGTATVALPGCSGNTGTSGDGSSADTSADSADTTSSSDTAVIDERYTADLTDLFADKTAFDAEIARIEDDVIPALAQAAGQISDEASLAAYLKLDDEATAAISQVELYAGMGFNVDSTDPDTQAEYRTASQVSQDADLARAIAEEFLASADEEAWQTFLSSDDLSLWRRSLTRIHRARSHVLTSADEALLKGAQTAQSNVEALFTTLNSSSFYLESTTDTGGADVVVTTAYFSATMTDADRDYRERVFKTYHDSLAKPGDIFAGNLDTFIKLCEDLASAHGYTSALEEAMEGNDVSQETFDTLVEGARANLDAYAAGNRLRAEALGIDGLMPWDRIVPLVAAPDTSFSYENAQSLILAALAPLGDDYVSKLEEVFANRWIDVYPSPGKSPGAETCDAAVGHPYIFMNFTDDFDSVGTLAHELGHLIHGWYSAGGPWSVAEKQPKAFTSEIASITNEILLTDYMADNAQSDAERLYYLSEQVSLIEVTFFRQVMFAAFEEQAHQSVIDGDTLSADSLNALFNDLYAQFYPGITATDENGAGWSYIVHFYLDYYVQNYAIAIAGAYSVVSDIESGRDGALVNYLEFLAAGDHLPADELYAVVGVDLSNGDYITPLVQKYQTLLDEVEKLR